MVILRVVLAFWICALCLGHGIAAVIDRVVRFLIRYESRQVEQILAISSRCWLFELLRRRRKCRYQKLPDCGWRNHGSMQSTFFETWTETRWSFPSVAEGQDSLMKGVPRDFRDCGWFLRNEVGDRSAKVRRGAFIEWNRSMRLPRDYIDCEALISILSK
jgi:hypothetical protein